MVRFERVVSKPQDGLYLLILNDEGIYRIYQGGVDARHYGIEVPSMGGTLTTRAGYQASQAILDRRAKKAMEEVLKFEAEFNEARLHEYIQGKRNILIKWDDIQKLTIVIDKYTDLPRRLKLRTSKKRYSFDLESDDLHQMVQEIQSRKEVPVNTVKPLLQFS